LGSGRKVLHGGTARSARTGGVREGQANGLSFRKEENATVRLPKCSVCGVYRERRVANEMYIRRQAYVGGEAPVVRTAVHHRVSSWQKVDNQTAARLQGAGR